jgi:hypothetical protein
LDDEPADGFERGVDDWDAPGNARNLPVEVVDSTDLTGATGGLAGLSS